MDQISIHHLPDFSELEGFHSGISEIDSFIVTGLNIYFVHKDKRQLKSCLLLY